MLVDMGRGGNKWQCNTKREGNATKFEQQRTARCRVMRDESSRQNAWRQCRAGRPLCQRNFLLFRQSKCLGVSCSLGSCACLLVRPKFTNAEDHNYVSPIAIAFFSICKLPACRPPQPVSFSFFPCRQDSSP